MTQGYVGFRKQKRSGLGTTLLIVAGVHLVIGAGLVWLAHTQVGKEWMKLYKIKIAQMKEKPPEPPPPPPPPKPEAPPPEPAQAPPPVPVEAPKSTEQVKASQPVSLPGFGNPFATGKRGKFAGYVDMVTSEIQKHYKQPPDLPTDIEYVVLCQLLLDENGRILKYQLVNSSGDKDFDESALAALAAVGQLRPPPPGMSPLIVVKFFPPA